MRKWMVVLIVVLWATVGLAEGVVVSVLTNDTTDQLEGRVGTAVDDQWEVGLLARWFTEDVGGCDWGAGGYMKMSVDPNATIALSDWLPAIGDWIGLPETVTAETFLVGKLLYVETDAGDTLTGALGGGFTLGPATLEVVYHIVDGGMAEDPMSRSGVETWFGCCLAF